MSFFPGQSKRPQGENVVTYRHLLSSSAMTVFNPLRVIGHCDIDGAFAQFEQVRLGLPDETPLICVQWDSIIAVNYPARKFGIKRDMSADGGNTLDAAKKRCPHLVIQHVATYREGESEAGYWDDVDRRTQKISLDPYRRESLKVLAVFREMAPKAELEKASIDEAFMDLTTMAIDRLLMLHPHLSKVPEDAPDGLDSPLPPPPPIDWSKSGNVFPVTKDEKDEGEENSDNGEQPEDTWQDWALCMGAEIMAEVREQVWKRLHYTCSAGIAHSKAMSKLCSAWKKPYAQTVLRMAAVPGFLRDMAFTDIRFLGGKLGNAIAEEFKAKTVGDMLMVSLEDMQAKFGEESIWVYNILRGVDHTEVKEKLSTKSMLASKNTIPNVRTPEQGHHWLSVLAGELHVRLREARQVTPSLWPKTIVMSTRSGWEPSRSRQAPFPFTRNLTPEYILKHGRKLWDEATLHIQKGSMKFNNISLQFTGLEKLEEGQRGIEGFFTAGKAEPGEKRPREGSAPVAAQPTPTVTSEEPAAKRTRLPTLHTTPRPTGLDSFLNRGKTTHPPGDATGTRSTASGAKTEPESPAEIIEMVDDNDGSTWNCPACDTTLSAPDGDTEWIRFARQEHEDYHFALSLQESENGGSSRPIASTASSTVRKRKTKQPAGIKAFFTPKS